MNLDRFREGPDDPQDTVKRWVGEVTVTYVVPIRVEDDCYGEMDAEQEAYRRICEGISESRFECDGELVDAREP